MNIKGIGVNADSSSIDGDLHSLISQLDYFAGLGIDYVEIPVHGLDIIMNGRLNKKTVSAVKKILWNFDLKYTVHAPDKVNLMDRDDPLTHHMGLEATIQFAGEIGAEIVVYHSSYTYLNRDVAVENIAQHGEPTEDQRYCQLMEVEINNLRHIGEYASAVGVTVAIENNFLKGSGNLYTYGIYPETLRDIIVQVNHPNVGICYDFGHGYLAAKQYGFDLIDGVETVAPYLTHIHVHDNFGRSGVDSRNIERIPFGIGDLHLPIGWGEIPYSKILPKLNNYTGVFMMEIHPRFHTYLGEIIRDIRKQLATLKS
ncbi:sugar phosphate isomerase/epimerase family protein [Calderihabitans maritimus]|uniref:Xylose isomerase-like TIM barrel domain-containing protein n=1 Tax=Calderihabitans maritimus TaxID=1246530 RepID=A0A1Z5HSS3_9FIRM|nr:sugar phosphate isomerase/epimerase [Calderihabitans maritimus]GAW92365.1 hypothetical protein KKC1_15200 [Calderihabitans maritimus]